MKKCKNCQLEFEITERDHKYYERINVPEPTLCPDCRQQRRLSFRNERSLYYRKCDLSGKEIVSIYPKNSQYKVYSQEEWWSDKWDPLDYGRDFDFNRSFFDQFAELTKDVPKIALVNKSNENSDYVNWVMSSRNCYLVTAARDNEDCLYSHWIWRSKDCVDCGYVYDSEIAYECTDCSHCYSIYYSQDCSNCKDSYFLKDCAGCSNCFCCIGLRGKEHYIFNKKYDKKSYEEEIKKYLPLKDEEIEDIIRKLEEAIPKAVTKFYHGYSTENCIGDYMIECKDCLKCFDIEKSEGCRYGENIMRCVDTVDCARTTLCELCYEGLSVVNSYNVLFSIMTWFSKECIYCDGCNSCKNCFGCVGLKSKEYCIFNKQYSKEEYMKLKKKIIEHMMKTGEYGEFFPASISPFKYEETVANEFYPEKEMKIQSRGDKEVGDALTCAVTGKPYKLTVKEKNFYEKHSLPIPKKCPDQRHKERMKRRNPRKLYDRKCANCMAEMSTTYGPDKPEIVYCENCYLQTIN